MSGYKRQQREPRPCASRRAGPDLRRARPNLDKLTHGEELFALEYLANGYNATAAYKTVHPKCSQRTAEVNGSRLLRKAKVRAFIEREQKERKKRLRMDADEALEGITRHARADIGALFSPDGKLLPIHQWPQDVRDGVKAIKSGPFGPTIVMYDKLKARELMAIAGGELKPRHEHRHRVSLADLLSDKPLPDEA